MPVGKIVKGAIENIKKKKKEEEIIPEVPQLKTINLYGQNVPITPEQEKYAHGTGFDIAAATGLKAIAEAAKLKAGKEALAFQAQAESEQRMKEIQPLLSKVGQIPEEQVIPETAAPEQKSVGGFLKMALTPGAATKRAEQAGIQINEGAISLGAGAAIPIAESIASKVAASTAAHKVATTLGGALSLSAITGKAFSWSRQKTKEATTLLSTSQTNLAQITDALNKGFISPEQAVGMWNSELMNLRTAEAALHHLNRNSLTSFLSGAGDEEIKLRSFMTADLPIYTQRFRNALISPNPNTITTINPEVQQEQEII